MLELELNNSGTLTFEIAPNHYYYENVKKRKSIIKVFQDDEIIFFGSPSDEVITNNLIKTITVEGALSWLNDTVQPYSEYHDISVGDYLQALISKHNSQVSEFKQFELGSVTVTDANNSLYRFTNYEKTKDSISDDLINSLGGYIKARHVDGTNYIDYTESSGTINSQGVRFGVNLIECSKVLKSSTIATAIIPLGAKINEDSEERLTIASVNNNLIYVHDEDSVEQFDWVFDTVVFDEMTVADNLKSKGLSELYKRKYLSGTYTINSIDMSVMDGNYTAIRVGDYIPIVSPVHNINDTMTVSAMSIDVCDPTQSTITIGSEFTTLTNSATHVDKEINSIKSNYATNKDVTDAKENVQSNIDTVVSRIEQNSSNITQLSDKIELSVSKTTSLEDSINDKSEILQQQITTLTQTSQEFEFSISEQVTDIEQNGVSKVQNTTVTIDVDGLSVGDDSTAFNTQMTPTSFVASARGQEVFALDHTGGRLPSLNVTDEMTEGYIRKRNYTRGDEEKRYHVHFIG